MTINAKRLASSTALCVAVFWVLCSIGFFMAPEAMRYATGAMLHLDLTYWIWDLRFETFVVGLLGWSISSWVTMWSIVTVYQRLLGGASCE